MDSLLRKKLIKLGFNPDEMTTQNIDQFHEMVKFIKQMDQVDHTQKNYRCAFIPGLFGVSFAISQPGQKDFVVTFDMKVFWKRKDYFLKANQIHKSVWVTDYLAPNLMKDLFDYQNIMIELERKVKAFEENALNPELNNPEYIMAREYLYKLKTIVGDENIIQSVMEVNTPSVYFGKANRRHPFKRPIQYYYNNEDEIVHFSDKWSDKPSFMKNSMIHVHNQNPFIRILWDKSGAISLFFIDNEIEKSPKAILYKTHPTKNDLGAQNETLTQLRFTLDSLFNITEATVRFVDIKHLGYDTLRKDSVDTFRQDEGKQLKKKNNPLDKFTDVILPDIQSNFSLYGENQKLLIVRREQGGLSLIENDEILEEFSHKTIQQNHSYKNILNRNDEALYLYSMLGFRSEEAYLADEIYKDGNKKVTYPIYDFMLELSHTDTDITFRYDYAPEINHESILDHSKNKYSLDQWVKTLHLKDIQKTFHYIDYTNFIFGSDDQKTLAFGFITKEPLELFADSQGNLHYAGDYQSYNPKLGITSDHYLYIVPGQLVGKNKYNDKRSNKFVPSLSPVDSSWTNKTKLEKDIKDMRMIVVDSLRQSTTIELSDYYKKLNLISE